MFFLDRLPFVGHGGFVSCNLQADIGTTRGCWLYRITGRKYVLPHGGSLYRLHYQSITDAGDTGRQWKV